MISYFSVSLKLTYVSLIYRKVYQVPPFVMSLTDLQGYSAATASLLTGVGSGPADQAAAGPII